VASKSARFRVLLAKKRRSDGATPRFGERQPGLVSWEFGQMSHLMFARHPKWRYAAGADTLMVSE